MKVTFEVDVDLITDEEWPQRRQEALRLMKSTEMCSALHSIVNLVHDCVKHKNNDMAFLESQIHGILERRGLLLDEMYS